MLIDPEQVRPADLYQTMIRLIAPRPIAWIGTVSSDGVPNLAPYSFFSGVTSRPPTLMFSSVSRPDGSLKDSVANILATGEFTVNVVPHRLAEAMLATSAEFPSEIDEFRACDIASAPGERIAAPRVLESPAHFECRLMQTVPIGQGAGSATIVIGRIVAIRVADEMLGADGFADMGRLDLVGRLGGDAYATTRDRFERKRPS
ncbi:MAG TPA: flavin reductase family protein [Planctomycetaceae bacterium]|nr:flavin reductase family protein [Planctomycetaceae bacterium]HRF00257.1 flavin reductase family protein [Pirellulaceae bacterium]